MNSGDTNTVLLPGKTTSTTSKKPFLGTLENIIKVGTGLLIIVAAVGLPAVCLHFARFGIPVTFASYDQLLRAGILPALFLVIVCSYIYWAASKFKMPDTNTSPFGILKKEFFGASFVLFIFTYLAMVVLINWGWLWLIVYLPCKLFGVLVPYKTLLIASLVLTTLMILIFLNRRVSTDSRRLVLKSGTTEVEWEDLGRLLISQDVPILGGLLRGPVNAEAGKLVAEILELDSDSPIEVINAVQSDSKAIQKLRQFEMDQNARMEEFQREETKAFLADIDSAKRREGKAIKLVSFMIASIIISIITVFMVKLILSLWDPAIVEDFNTLQIIEWGSIVGLSYSILIIFTKVIFWVNCPNRSIRRFGLVFAVVLGAVIYLAGATYYSYTLYPNLPKAIGGGKPEEIIIWVSQDVLSESRDLLSIEPDSLHDGELIKISELYLLLKTKENYILTNNPTPPATGWMISKDKIHAVSWPKGSK